MEISGVISAIVIGIVIGVLGRLVVPGRQRIGVLWTILIGIVAAFIGTGIASGLGVADTKGVDWVEWLIQIALAALGVAAVSRIKLRRCPAARTGPGPPPGRSRAPSPPGRPGHHPAPREPSACPHVTPGGRPTPARRSAGARPAVRSGPPAVP